MSSDYSPKGLSPKFHKARANWNRAQGERQVARESRSAQACLARASRQYNGKQQAVYQQEDLQKFRAKFGLQNPAVRRLFVRAVCMVALVSLAANAVMYSRWSDKRPLVRVGQRVVTRGEYYSALDQAAGKSVLNQIVLSELIRQAAASDAVPVSSSDIDARLATLRRTRPQGIPPTDTPGLRDQIGLTLALENLRIRHVTASDAEALAFYNAHKAAFVLPTQMRNTVVVTATAPAAAQAAALLHQHQTAQAIAAHPGLHVVGVNGFALNLNALPPSIAQRLRLMHQGDVQMFPVSHVYLTFGVNERDDATLPSLSQIYDQVVRQVKLAKAPSEQAELALLYQGNKPSFDMANYAQDFREFEPLPSSPDAKRRTASLPQ